jgi:hypothetical protein
VPGRGCLPGFRVGDYDNGNEANCNTEDDDRSAYAYDETGSCTKPNNTDAD